MVSLLRMMSHIFLWMALPAAALLPAQAAQAALQAALLAELSALLLALLAALSALQAALQALPAALSALQAALSALFQVAQEALSALLAALLAAAIFSFVGLFAHRSAIANTSSNCLRYLPALARERRPHSMAARITSLRGDQLQHLYRN